MALEQEKIFPYGISGAASRLQAAFRGDGRNTLFARGAWGSNSPMQRVSTMPTWLGVKFADITACPGATACFNTYLAQIQNDTWRYVHVIHQTYYAYSENYRAFEDSPGWGPVPPGCPTWPGAALVIYLTLYATQFTIGLSIDTFGAFQAIVPYADVGLTVPFELMGINLTIANMYDDCDELPYPDAAGGTCKIRGPHGSLS